MSNPDRTALLATAALSAGLMAVAVGVYLEAGRAFDPGIDVLGPAIVPRVLSVAIAALAAALLVASVVRYRKTRATGPTTPGTAAQGGAPPRRWDTLAATMAATVIYVLALDFRWLGYFPATAAYVALLCLMLGPRDPRGVFAAVALGVGLSALTLFAFTRFFVTGLPQ